MPRAVDQWVRTQADEAAVDQGCTFKLALADRVRRFFSGLLRHSKGQWAGKPFELLPWQWGQVIAPLFGWVRPDGTRRFRKAGVWLAKKNGKSALASGISLYMLVGDGEQGAEVYNAAADRDQAAIVFNEAANMVQASLSLSSRLEVVRSTKRIVFPERNSTYRALSAEVPTKEGLNWHALIVDELHAQPNRELWDTLLYGGRARRQPLMVSISTAGYDRDSIGYEQYLYAKGILEGNNLDTAFLPYIAEAGPEDDWREPETWRKANPSLGVTVTEETFRQECEEAQASPAKENTFRRYLLNQWTEQDVRWLSLERWDACGGKVDADDLAGHECYIGLDLASTTDTAAAVLLFPGEDDTYDVLPFFWLPESADRRREKENRQRLTNWMRDGLIHATPGDVIDYDEIRATLNDLAARYSVREVVIDPWNSTQLATQLMGDGFNVVQFRQGFGSMSAPTKELEKLVLGKRLRHGGHPVLRWMAGNVSVEQDAAGNLKPSKKRSPEKIDGVVALVMALGRAMVRESADWYAPGILKD